MIDLNWQIIKEVILNDHETTIKLSRRGQAMDLGGNIFALGKKIDGTPWRVGIQGPLGLQGRPVGVLSVENKSVVTSGNYERYFIKDGTVSHHLIDPKTGYPSETGVSSATIISDHSIDGDALSTCAYVMGVDEGLKLIGSMEGIEALFITADRKIYLTPGVRESFILSDPGYSFH